ncbi:hypothetical protein LTR95_012032 [Oleoguttula sp. CCFEE 5521]
MPEARSPGNFHVFRDRSLTNTGHYSYECTASQQDRPYAARPSRTQQLLNPKLAPKLTNEAPKELVPKDFESEQIDSWAATSISIEFTNWLGLGLSVYHIDQPISTAQSSTGTTIRKRQKGASQKVVQ